MTAGASGNVEKAERQFCTLCRNRCPLDNPKCPEVLTAKMRAEKMTAGGDSSCCTMCQNRCPYTALRCEIGRTTARIKGKLPPEESDSQWGSTPERLTPHAGHDF